MLSGGVDNVVLDVVVLGAVVLGAVVVVLDVFPPPVLSQTVRTVYTAFLKRS